MSRTPANVTQADIARAIRAARQTGAGKVEIRPDGTIIISLERSANGAAVAVEESGEVVL